MPCAAAILLSIFAHVADTPAATVHGVVRANGAAVQGADILLRTPDETLKAETSIDGAFAISYAGPFPVTIQATFQSGDGTAAFHRGVTRTVTNAEPLVLELFPGACTVTGAITTNGEPVPGAAAYLRNDVSSISACALADEDGVYRIPNMPAGNYTLAVHAQESSIPVAMILARRRANARPIVVTDGAENRFDVDHRVGEAVVSLSGLRPDEIGRLVVLPGGFSGEELTQRSIERLLRHSTHTVVVTRDRNVLVENLEEGAHAFFFAGFKSGAGTLIEVYKKMRVTFKNVSVEAKSTAEIELVLPDE